MKAYIMIETKPGTSEEVIKTIKEKVEGVILADSIYGRFDAIVVIEAPSLEELNDIIYEVVEKSPNIIHTETSITLF